MSDTQKEILVSGAPVPDDRSHTELKPNGQQKDYVVLTEEERAKGFTRPVRHTYIHIGKYLRGELEMFETPRVANGQVYVALDRFEISGGAKAGSYLTQQEVDQLQAQGRFGGCGAVTSMNTAIAETYARDPHFYSGTFCVNCGHHFSLNEFVWDGTDIQVGT